MKHCSTDDAAKGTAALYALGALSQLTRRIRIGFGVCILPAHHPIRVAERTAMIDQLTDGRLEVGTGRSNAYEQIGQGIDPNNTRKGLSPLASLYREIFTDDEAANMTASLMRNIGVPGVVLSPANTSGPTGRFKDPEEMKARLEAYVEGGITLPIVTPITTPERTGDLIEALAP